jgi:hypothetical protein
MGHGGFANPPTGTRPVSSGGAGLGLAREGLPLYLHISAAAEQGSYASQKRVTKAACLQKYDLFWICSYPGTRSTISYPRSDASLNTYGKRE